MKKIQLLSEETINKISAGEVVESPLSVVKELVENALDASASMIKIEIQGGGFHLISVADNGMGMDADDAVLCFERHATSKISDIQDLNTLNSMGFRGEALAAIASVSKITLTTATEQNKGIKVEVEAGNILSIDPYPKQKGSTFVVRSLFYNTPARKKFQKSPNVCSASIHKLLIGMALSHPEIGFELISNKESIFKVFPSNQGLFIDQLQQRIKDLIKKTSSQYHLKLDCQLNDCTLKGFFNLPSDNRINRSGQYIFINRRLISSPLISHIIKDGYGQRLGVDRYPAFVLHLLIPPELVDVNVHPQKKEVRFQEDHKLKNSLRIAINTLFDPISFPPTHKEIPSDVPAASFQVSSLSEPALLKFREDKRLFFDSIVETESVVGLFQFYLLLDASTVPGFDQGVLWVDLKKIQEQLIWRQLNETDTFMGSQGLLIPLPFRVTSVEAHSLQLNEQRLKRSGFSLQQTGKEDYLIDSIPVFVEERDAVDVIRLILSSEDSFEILSKKIIRFAIRGKKNFMLHEALALWQKFKTISSVEGCYNMGLDEIAKLFK